VQKLRITLEIAIAEALKELLTTPHIVKPKRA